MKVLIVVDMQKDFVCGSLGTDEAQAIVEGVRRKAESFDGKVIYTRDTHSPEYLATREGRNLPVEHCIKDTDGWQIMPELPAGEADAIIDKPTFGSIELGELLVRMNAKEPIEEMTLVGLCTDICVISNALICKAFLPEVPVVVDASCCAGVTPQSHRTALDAMRPCQIEIINE